MDSEKKCEEARRNAWDKAKDVRDRIQMLQKVVSNCPEYMIPYSDIAVSYIGIGKIENAIEVYQQIINLKDNFQHIWSNILGKAYLYTKRYDNAIETFEKSRVFDYDQGFFLALVYLKKGGRKKFEEQFDKWISDDLEKSFNQHFYMKKIKALFNEAETKFINKVWDKYYKKYSNMDKYVLYCELYKQHYLKPCITDEEFDDDDFEMPEKLNRLKFENLSGEYLYLDRKTMFGDSNDDDYEKFFELRDLLFADIIYG